MAARCKVCGGRRFAVIYKGKIRSGGVGSKSVEGYKVLECRTCRLNFLSPLPEHLEKYYESDE